jgi:hypothetical protein
MLRENMMDVIQVCGGAEDRCRNNPQDQEACAAHEKCGNMQRAHQAEQEKKEREMRLMCDVAMEKCGKSGGEDQKACDQVTRCDEQAQQAMAEMQRMCKQAEDMCSNKQDKGACDMHNQCKQAAKAHMEAMAQ